MKNIQLFNSFIHRMDFSINAYQFRFKFIRSVAFFLCIFAEFVDKKATFCRRTFYDDLGHVRWTSDMDIMNREPSGKKIFFSRRNVVPILVRISREIVSSVY